MSEMFVNMDGDIMERDFASSDEKCKWHKAGWDAAILETKFFVEALRKVIWSVNVAMEREGSSEAKVRIGGIAQDALSKYREIVGPELSGDPGKENEI